MRKALGEDCRGDDWTPEERRDLLLVAFKEGFDAGREWEKMYPSKE